MQQKLRIICREYSCFNSSCLDYRWYCRLVFQQQGEIAPPVSMEATDVDYEATDIKAVQTNEKGETEYELTAKTLTHNPETNLDEMSGITMNWEPSAEQRYRIEAGSAAISQQTGELSLSGAFHWLVKVIKTRQILNR